MYAATGEAKHKIGVTYLKNGRSGTPGSFAGDGLARDTVAQRSEHATRSHNALNTRAHTKSASWEWVRLKKISTQEVHCLLK